MALQSNFTLPTYNRTIAYLGSVIFRWKRTGDVTVKPYKDKETGLWSVAKVKTVEVEGSPIGVWCDLDIMSDPIAVAENPDDAIFYGQDVRSKKMCTYEGITYNDSFFEILKPSYFFIKNPGHINGAIFHTLDSQHSMKRGYTWECIGWRKFRE